MTLRTRLLLLTVALLLLPLFGWQMVRTLEAGLRESYEQALIDTAGASAARLEGRVPSPPPGTGLYVHDLDLPVRLDGRAGEWSSRLPFAQTAATVPPGTEPLEVLAAESRGRLHLLIRIDRERFDLDAGSGGGRLAIAVDNRGLRSSIVVEPSAPGWLQAENAAGDLRLRVALQPGERGWTLEAAFDRPRQPDAVAVELFESGKPAPAAEASGEWTSAMQPLVRPVPELADTLVETLPERTRGWVVDPRGWILAGARGRPSPGADVSDGGAGGGLAALGARMLGIDTTGSDAATPIARLAGDARGTEPAARWLFDTDARLLRVRARAPVGPRSDPAAFVVLERNADRFMTTAHAALVKLFLLGLGAIAVLGGAVIGFAGGLSRRIRRLRDAVEAAVSRDGRIVGNLPASRTRDELGDLARDIATIIERQRHHQDYLDSLADKLSHELRTPVAMIRSSLDNLAESADPEERERFRDRAEEGCVRLQRTFEAMREANRIERSLDSEPLVAVDAGALVDHYCKDCRETFATHDFAAVVPVRRAARVLGSPEQLAQMLDKLVENAVDFTPPGARITLRVVPRGRAVAIQVDNPGSRLPRNLDGTLFDSMVSGRDAGGPSHLGLGLYIVRLIAERHRGRVRAMQLDDGCRFEVELPRERLDQDSR